MTRKHSLFLMPFIMTVVLSSILFVSLLLVNAPYKWNTVGCAIVCSLLWGGVWLWDQKRISSKNDDKKMALVKINTFLYIGVIFIVVWFMACTSWNPRQDLTLNPVQAIDNGTMHADTLFFASLSESYNHSQFATLLVNDEPHLKYHTFSIYVMHLISLITGIQSLFVYNFLYPLIFFPLYGFTFMKAISSMKKLFVGNCVLSIIDVVLVAFAMIGILPEFVLDASGIWKSSTMLSESYMFAVILSFIFFSVLPYGLLSKETRVHRFFCMIVLPAFIILISASKISVGFIMTGAICYYFFRLHKKFSLPWVLAFVYAVLFVGCFFVFSAKRGGAETGVQWRLLAFRVYCANYLFLLGHYLYLALPMGAFCFIHSQRERYDFVNLRQDFRKGRTVWIELMALVAGLGFLPGLLLHIPGGNAAYFSYFVEVFGIVFLCANNYLNSFILRFQGKYLGVLCLLWGMVLLVGNISLAPITWNQIENVHVSQLFEDTERLRQLTKGNEQEYVLYVRKDALGAKTFSHPIAKVFLYPALTGCSVINATYYRNGQLYNYADEEVGFYGLYASRQQEKLSLPQAMETARSMGKRYLIEISSTEHSVIPLT